MQSTIENIAIMLIFKKVQNISYISNISYAPFVIHTPGAIRESSTPANAICIIDKFTLFQKHVLDIKSL